MAKFRALFHKELTAPERDARTAIYTGLIKKHGNVVSGASWRGRGKTLTDDKSLPTVAEKVAAELGVSKTAVQQRVARAAGAAGLNGVTIEKTEADDLIDVGKKALENPSDWITITRRRPGITTTTDYRDRNQRLPSWLARTALPLPAGHQLVVLEAMTHRR